MLSLAKSRFSLEDLLGVAPEDWPAIADEIAADFASVAELFGLTSVRADATLERLRQVAQPEAQPKTQSDEAAEECLVTDISDRS